MHVLAAFLTAFVLPGFTSIATEPSGGQVFEGQFPGTTRPGLVYLPPNFDPSVRYPVVYLLHGMPGSPSEYTNGTDLGTFADAQISAGTLRPFIAVIPAAGTDPHYDGEWAGEWETAVVKSVVPWVDSTLPTIATPAGRVLAGLSAGGYGAFDIALRHPSLFGAVESWSGYFTPLRDGPFKNADAATLAANNPSLLARTEAVALRRAGIRFLVSTGPYHSHWIPRGTTQAFARELRGLGLPVALRVFPDRVGEWSEQVDAGLKWAFAP